eukprot:2454303-Rhodomonas_salina.2
MPVMQMGSCRLLTRSAGFPSNPGTDAVCGARSEVQYSRSARLSAYYASGTKLRSTDLVRGTNLGCGIKCPILISRMLLPGSAQDEQGLVQDQVGPYARATRSPVLTERMGLSDTMRGPCRTAAQV